MFEIFSTTNFNNKYKKLTKNNKLLAKQTLETVNRISLNPKERGLKAHKVITDRGEIAWSSKVNGDIRIVWQYRKDKFDLIELLTIGGHSGKNKVYK